MEGAFVRIIKTEEKIHNAAHFEAHIIPYAVHRLFVCDFYCCFSTIRISVLMRTHE